MQKKIKTNFLEITPDSWPDAKLIGHRLPGYSFRGQSDNEWQLTTNVERLAKNYSVDKKLLSDREKIALSKFKSRAHQYIQSPPDDNNNIEWLSIIQDYGGPTRLLDFTHSFYVAAFFAMESATKDACIWCVSDLELIAAPLLSKKNFFFPKEDHSYILDPPEPYNDFAEAVIKDPQKSIDIVVMVFPSRLNERLAVQQGLFFFNCNIENTFESSLCQTLNFPFDTLSSDNSIHLTTNQFLAIDKEFDKGQLPDRPSDKSNLISKDDLPPKGSEKYIKGVSILKVNLSRKFHQEAMGDLESMNINYASLFPGLEGFARSIKK